MSKSSNSRREIIYTLIYFAMVFSLLYIFGLIIRVDLSIPIQILIVVAGSSLVLFFIRKPMVFYMLLVLAVIIALSVNRYREPFILDAISRSIEFMSNIFEHMQGKVLVKTENILWFWGIQLTLTSLVTGWILFKSRQIYWLLPLYLSFFVYYWYTYIDQALVITSIFIGVFFVLMGTEKYYKSNFDSLYKPWIRTVVFYSIAIVLLASWLPKGNNFLHSNWLEQKVYDMFPIIEDMRGGSSYVRGVGQPGFFDLAQTSYRRETGKLGGPVILRDQVLMTVNTNIPIYLRGSVRQIYSGESWESIESNYDVYGLYEDFGGLTQEEVDKYYRVQHLTITHQLFISRTLFSPYKPVEIHAAGNHEVFVYPDDVLVYPNGIYKGESYIVKVQRPLGYATLVSLGINRTADEIPDTAIYLNLPGSITDRTAELTAEIVQDANNDLEKALAIEKYLRENYRYTLEGERLPLNQEFVDFFLFDSKKGYCTYYATAMAVMLRLEGIPSRYVEGFAVQNMVVQGVYEVLESNSHAWVEAFIEPVGWMTFEPTSSLPAVRHQIVLSAIPGTPTDPSDIDDDRGQRGDIDDIKIDDDYDIDGGGVPVDVGEPTIPFAVTRVALWLMAFALIGFVPMKLLLGVVRFEHFKRQMVQLNNKSRVIFLYQYIIMLTSESGYPPKDGETHYEFASRIAYKFQNQGQKSIKDITVIFVKSKYSLYPVSDMDVTDLEDYSKVMEKRLKNDWGSWSFYYRKFMTKDFIKDFKFESLNHRQF